MKEKWTSFNYKHIDLDIFSNSHTVNPLVFSKNKDSYLNQVHCKMGKVERDTEENVKLAW